VLIKLCSDPGLILENLRKVTFHADALIGIRNLDLDETPPVGEKLEKPSKSEGVGKLDERVQTSVRFPSVYRAER